ncbi:hypothetical protein AB0L71_28045 [Streptomyces sp. NPDC052052]|uniref:hypothetical protein n=1 Tax=Streptomyces sp. NPDC052052 TaxID=3154756 RepID=UPI00341292FE
MPASKAKIAEVTERRTKLVHLRRAGINFDDPRILALGYSSRQSASKDFHRLMKKRAADEAAEVALYRQESKERLLSLLASVWPAATGTGDDLDLKAHEQARKIVADLDDLLGTKVPVRTEISGPDGGDIPFSSGELSEFRALVDIADQPDAPAPSLDHDEEDEEEDEDQADDDDSDS